MNKLLIFLTSMLIVSCSAIEETANNDVFLPCKTNGDCSTTQRCVTHTSQERKSCLFLCQTNQDCLQNQYCVETQTDFKSCYGCSEKTPDQCEVLGSIHYGQGNYQKAKSYFELSCNKGYGDGCSGLALLYKEGHGVEHDMDRAISLYTQGCELRSVESCFAIAFTYQELGNHKDAIIYFEQACQQYPNCQSVACRYMASVSCGEVKKYSNKEP